MMISIIIPVYNAEKYIDNCIKSILNQTYNNLEIIVVNDGSTDATEAVLSKYLNYKNFKLINKDNEGPSIARKVGLDNSHGQYVSFVDADDYLDENFYEVMLNEMLDKNVDIVECGYKFVDSNGKVIKNSNMYNEYVNNNCVEHYVLKTNTTNYLWNRLFKKELFKNVVFPKFYAGEDSCILLQLHFNSERLLVLSDNMYNYVQTELSLCRKPYNLKRNDSVDAGIFMYNFCKQKKCSLANYYASYICMNAAICYSELRYSQIENKDIYMTTMLQIFKKYIPKDKFKNLKVSRARKLFVAIFYASPEIASFIYKKVFKK